MSTYTPVRGTRAQFEICFRLIDNDKGSPGWTELSAGSTVMSERFRISSTKYGPSVSDGDGTSEHDCPSNGLPSPRPTPARPKLFRICRLFFCCIVLQMCGAAARSLPER